MRIFITGATGFIGSNLVRILSEDGHQISALIRQSPRKPWALRKIQTQVRIYSGNLLDFSSLSWILREEQPEIILHLGAITKVGYSFTHPFEVLDINFIGTVNLAEAARRVLPELGMFLFASSVEVYGFQVTREPFTEEMPPFPIAPYAVAKHSSEKYLQYLAKVYDFPALILRQSNTYGRRYDFYFVVEAFISAMLLDSKEVNFGRSEPVRNFIYIDDLTNLYRAILKQFHELHPGEIFNTGPPNGRSIGELAEGIARLLDWSGKINWGTRELRPGEVPYLNTFNEKITEKIGWRPEIGLDVGLRKTIRKVKKGLKAQHLL